MTIISPPENVIAIQTSMGFEQTLAALRTELPAREFRILSEVDFRRELDNRIGISSSRYHVLIVWHPFSAYQAILSDPNGGLMVPFNVAVYENGRTTIVSVLSQPALDSDASLGIRVLGQELNRRMRDVLLHLGTHEKPGNGSVGLSLSMRK
jgi:uncharacterized protein (DUF302 family)